MPEATRSTSDDDAAEDDGGDRRDGSQPTPGGLRGLV
jgi:hypothetical protein